MYPIYYAFVFLSFLYCLFKFKGNLVANLIIFAFYAGLAAFPGKAIENPYKVLLLSVSLFAAIKLQPFEFKTKKDRTLFVSFMLFTTIFFVSSILNNNKLILILSQYGKYLTPFIIFFILKNAINKRPPAFYKMTILMVLLLSIQIILSFVKLLTLGITETTVGSIAYMGGGPATIVPIIGFILIWALKKGQLENKDWCYVVLLIFIAFMSVKRSIWFIMPVIILSFLFYVPKKKLSTKLFWILPILPVIFYLGVRLNPTLNKEQKMWGSFDINFVLQYSQKYNFGDAEKSGGEKMLGQGRGGATLLLLSKLKDPTALTWEDLFGYGLEEFVTKNYNTFDENKYGLNSKGAVTGFFNTYISFGFIGVITFLIYAFQLMSYIKNRRIKYVVISLFIWEYFFYIGMLFTTQAISILFIFVILFLSREEEIRLLPDIRFPSKNVLKI